MRSFSIDRFGQRSHEKFMLPKRVSKLSIYIFFENDNTSMKMGLNGSAMSPQGLIFDEDGAISCPMPLDALPTPFKAVLSPFRSVLSRKGVDIFFPRLGSPVGVIFRIWRYGG